MAENKLILENLVQVFRLFKSALTSFTHGYFYDMSIKTKVNDWRGLVP